MLSRSHVSGASLGAANGQSRFLTAGEKCCCIQVSVRPWSIALQFLESGPMFYIDTWLEQCRYGSMLICIYVGMGGRTVCIASDAGPFTSVKINVRS